MKFVGMLLTVVAGVGLGLYYAHGLTRRVRFLQQTERLLEALLQWKTLFAEALACRGGGTAVSPLARELSSQRGPDELLRAIGQLDKCMEYAQGNVSPAAICGYLVWAL